MLTFCLAEQFDGSGRADTKMACSLPASSPRLVRKIQQGERNDDGAVSRRSKIGP